MSAEVEDSLDSYLVTEEMEGDEAQEVNKKENPLYNPLILANIFKFVESAEDFKNIRLTCSLWLQESLKQWDSLVIYTINLDNPCGGGKCTCQSRFISESKYHQRTYSLQEFLANWESAEPRDRQLMRRFRLTGFCLLHPRTDELMRFFNLVGSQMTYLHLDHCTFYRSNYVNGVKWILSKCLNLQQLIVILDRQPEYVPYELEDSSSYENLKRLSFMRCKRVDHYHVPDAAFRHLVKVGSNIKTFEMDIDMLADESISVLTQLQPSTLPWRFVNLTLNDCWLYRKELEIYAENLIMFIQNTLPTLKGTKLAVDVTHGYDLANGNNAIEGPFARLLASCQNSLKELDVERSKAKQGEVFRPISRSFVGLEFPCLTHLYLNGEVSVSFTSLGEAAPNLKLLHLKSALENNWNMSIERDGDSQEGERILLEKLENFYTDYFWFLPKSLKILKKWMPNIKEMGIVVKLRTQPMILELWPNLDKLVFTKGSTFAVEGMPISSDVVQAGVGKSSD